MTDPKLFRLDADGREVELRGSTVALEVELQRRVEAGMEAMPGIRFLASGPDGSLAMGPDQFARVGREQHPGGDRVRTGSDSRALTRARPDHADLLVRWGPAHRSNDEVPPAACAPPDSGRPGLRTDSRGIRTGFPLPSGCTRR